MVVLITCKNEEDLIKIEGSRVATRLYVDFSDIRGSFGKFVAWHHNSTMR